MNSKACMVVFFAISLMVCGIVVAEDEVYAAGDNSSITEKVIASASGDCGTTNAKWTYNVSNNTLTISGSGAVKAYSTTGTGSWDVSSVTYEKDTEPNRNPTETLSDIFTKTGISLTVSGTVTIDASAFANLSIGSVSFDSKYTSISASAFKNCKYLTNADLSSITSVGAEAFSGCTSLTKVTFNSSSTSTTSTNIGANAFNGCTSLKSIDIGKSTISENSFSGCTALTAITATGSTSYKIDSSLVYSYDGKTM